MPLILAEVQLQYPDLEIHQVEFGVPDCAARAISDRCHTS